MDLYFERKLNVRRIWYLCTYLHNTSHFQYNPFCNDMCDGHRDFDMLHFDGSCHCFGRTHLYLLENTIWKIMFKLLEHWLHPKSSALLSSESNILHFRPHIDNIFYKWHQISWSLSSKIIKTWAVASISSMALLTNTIVRSVEINTISKLMTSMSCSIIQ